jgi:peptidoglycan glycosyltransferase
MADWQDRTFLCTGVLQAGNREITDAGTNRAEGKLTEHGAVTLKKAFALSCNNTFAQAALEMGDQSLRKTAEEFGFNGQFLFRDLVVEDSVYPTLNRTEYEIAMTGIGQSALQVTPLHMCMIAGAVANNGLMMEPWMIREAASASGSRRAAFSAQAYRRALNAQQAKVLKEYMRAVVTGGTGSRAAIPGKAVCGKTGTAELDDPKNPGGTIVNAWFVGFLDEADAPYCLAVMVENAENGGGTVAAPIAKQIFSWLLNNGISP